MCVIGSMQLRGREKERESVTVPVRADEGVCNGNTKSLESFHPGLSLSSQAFITAIERKDEREGGAKDSRYLLLPELIM